MQLWGGVELQRHSYGVERVRASTRAAMRMNRGDLKGPAVRDQGGDG